MPSIEKETHFVMRNGKAEYPSVAQEDLLVWYDAKGKHNPDRHKDTLLDLSGNNRHAELYNFAYEKKSGYLETPEGGLLFDDVDDKLVYPSVKDEVEYTSASRNVANGWEGRGLVNYLNGVIGPTQLFGYTDFIEIKAGVEYIASSDYVLTSNLYLITYDDDENYVGYGASGKKKTESNAKYMRIRGMSPNGADFNLTGNIQLEEGTNATSYTPYVPLPVMTYQYNGNILSYEADGTVKRVDDGKVIERKGINLVRNGNFADGMKGWFTTNGISEMSRSDTGGVELSLLNNLATHARISQDLSINSSIGTALYFKIKVTTLSENINYCRVFLRDGTGGAVIANRTAQIYNQVIGQTYELEAIAVNNAELVNNKIYVMADFYRKGDTAEKLSARIEDIQVINLTEAYGAGNEPTLEYIQDHPEEFAWTPNPNDLIEAHEIKNNLVGDLEDLHGTGDKTEILSGVGEVFTDKADDSVVHVEIDGKSYQHAGSGKNLWINDSSHWEQGSMSSSNGSFMVATNRIRSKEFVPAKSSQTYTLKNHSSGIQSIVMQWDEDKNYLSSTYWQNQITFNTANNTAYFKYIITFSPGGTIEAVDAESLCIQLEEGSTATEYEPPVPSPDYPIEIHSLNDFDVVSSVGYNNQFLNTDFRNGLTHWRLTNNADGGYQGNEGWSIANSRYSGLEQTIPHYESLRGHVLYGRVELKSDSQSSYFVFFNDGFTQATRSVPPDTFGHFTAVSAVSTINNESKRIYCRIQDARTEGWTETRIRNLYVLDLTEMYGKGNEPTQAEMDVLFKDKWAPSIFDITEDGSSHPSIDKANILLSEQLRSVGDVKDRLFRDSDGLWKVERNVGEFRVTSNTGISVDGPYYYLMQLRVPTRKVISSHFSEGIKNNNPNVFAYSGGNYVEFYGRGMTLQDFRAWFIPLGAVFNYATDSPVIETLPQADQDKLNNIATYSGSNYVYTVLPDKDASLAEQLQPTIHAKFRKLSWFWSRLLFNQLKIWKRNLTDSELLHEWKQNKKRWGM